MLAIYVNNRYVGEYDTPRDVILSGILLVDTARKMNAPCDVTIGNDFGDRWPLKEYIEKIERFTAVRIPEKERLDNT